MILLVLRSPTTEIVVRACVFVPQVEAWSNQESNYWHFLLPTVVVTEKDCVNTLSAVDVKVNVSIPKDEFCAKYEQGTVGAMDKLEPSDNGRCKNRRFQRYQRCTNFDQGSGVRFETFQI